MDALDRLSRSLSSPGTEIFALVVYPAETLHNFSIDDSYGREFGYLRSIVPEVVQGYLKCGDLAEGFARVRCPNCHHMSIVGSFVCRQFLLAFNCRAVGSGVSLRSLTCPSCHTKKVVQFGLHLKENILYPVPHRQYVFSIPNIHYC